MAALELEGTLVRKLPVQKGTSARGEWAKQEFILEYQEGNFPAKLVLNVWGAEKVAELAGYPDGSKVKVSFNLSSREFNGRWYTDVRAWKITFAGEAQESRPSYADDMPAGFAPTRQSSAPASGIPAPTLDDMPGEAEDDLPF